MSVTPLSRSELDATRHGTLMECGCKVCRLLATVDVLTAECRAWRTWNTVIDQSGEFDRAEVLNAARSRTDAAKILETP